MTASTSPAAGLGTDPQRAGSASRAAAPGIPPARYGERLAAARGLVRERGLDGLLIGVGAELRYLTGYVAMPLERLTMLVVPADGPFRLVAPQLETIPARSSPAATAGFVDVVGWAETDDPIALVLRILEGSLDVPSATLARLAVSDRLWATFLLRLQAAFPGTRFEVASGVLRALRMRKDADEVALLRLAAQAADRVVAQIAAGRLIGRTEADVSREVRERLIAEGHEAAEFAIVGSGPNSASPHHDASDRRIAAGEPIVLDIGGTLAGYGSDITRTLWVTGPGAAIPPGPEFLGLYGLLATAQAEATRAVRPGVPAERIDAVAREIIGAGGHGEHFIHRVGHGIGLEAHEDPYLVAGNAEPLAEGMAFSVEPGIYLEGRYGARIEDIVVCGSDGPIVLNEVSRDLLVVEG